MNNFFSSEANPFWRRFLSRSIAIFIVVCVVFSGSLSAESDLPSNLDAGLRQLVSEQQQIRAATTSRVRGGEQQRLARVAVRDAARRVLVKIHLNGKAPLSDVERALP